MPWRTHLLARLGAYAAEPVRKLSNQEAGTLEEIRIRVNRPMELVFSGTRRMTTYIPDGQAMNELVASLCGYARYARERQLAQGFIPLPGGHRAGVCGQVLLKDGEPCGMSGISSVCIRVARRIPGASETIRPFLLDECGHARRVLFFGPPGCGKTTVLHDAALYLSDIAGLHVSIVDEREELGDFDRSEGMRVDIVSGICKADAMNMLIRTMSPEVIVTDELGKKEDVAAVLEAARCGIGLLASVHGSSMQELKARPMLRELMNSSVFDCCILLGWHGSCLQVWDAQRCLG